MKTLTGHTNPESAYIVNDYPYGFRLRTKIRYWIETNKKGQRFMSQTLNPKTQEWNKAKAGTYSDILVMGLNDETQYMECESLRFNDSEEKIKDFMTRHSVAIDDRAQNIIKHIRAHNKAMERVTWSIHDESSGKPAQTMQEQLNIINSLYIEELKNMKKEESQAQK